MRKIICNLFLGMTIICSSHMSGQTIPNPNFDSWTTLPYSEPISWTTSNNESLRKIGAVTTTSVIGSTGFGVRMQTKVIGPDTMFGYIFNGPSAGDPMAGEGGLPYSQKPTTIIGQYRYNLPGNDTAIIAVVFKKNSVIISSNLMKIRGTGNQPTFTSFSYSLAVSSATTTPDSVIIAFASSNAITNVGIQNNSFLEVDEINFVGPGITQTIANGSFENWTASAFNKLNNWAVAGEGFSQVTPGQSGPYAIKMETLLYPGNFVGPSGVCNGFYPPQGGPPKGGQPYTQTLDTIYGYYKFSGSNDSGVIFVNLKKLGVTVGTSVKYFKTQANWTLFKLPILSGQAPDTMRLEMYSSMPPGNLTAVGSKLSIDNLSLKSQPNGFIKLTSSLNNIYFFPNPSKNIINLHSSAAITGTFKVYDSNGRIVKLNNISTSESELKFNIENLANGLYFVHLETKEGTVIEKFIKE